MAPDDPPEVTAERIDARLQELYERHLASGMGQLAQFYEPGRGAYPPREAGEERGQFGISLASLDGEVAGVGDWEVPFALQSMAKVLAYCVALKDHGREEVMRHVGVEPSGEAYNSLAFDVTENRPFNPMVNAGALATTALVRGRDPEERFARILDIARRFAGNPTLDADAETFAREQADADRNRGTAYLMRSQGMLPGGADVETTVDLYLRQCSIQMTCRDLALTGATLANGGVNPVTGERVLPRARARDVLTVMYTCGMYDFAGEWAFEVGVPAKSGVSGGILAAIPQKMGIGVFSPGLDRHGNSVRGVQVCREVSGRLGLHVFATDAEDALLGASAPQPG